MPKERGVTRFSWGSFVQKKLIVLLDIEGDRGGNPLVLDRWTEAEGWSGTSRHTHTF